MWILRYRERDEGEEERDCERPHFDVYIGLKYIALAEV
jgi:hypothetical protein